MSDAGAREMLPMPDRPHPGLITYDARDPDTSFSPIEPLRPPEGAPNVLVVLIDDVGFAASSAFGGPINTPTAERLAAEGLKYNRFHTTALCSPTRAALLSGRNHHVVGMGGITEIATSAPGYSSLRPPTRPPPSPPRPHPGAPPRVTMAPPWRRRGPRAMRTLPGVGGRAPRGRCRGVVWAGGGYVFS